jgi:hypothetical protein
VANGWQSMKKWNKELWTGGQLLWQGDHQAYATSGQIPESQWELHRKLNIHCI